jgi:hypothetical protein
MRRNKTMSALATILPFEYPGTNTDSGAISADSASMIGESSRGSIRESFFELFSASLSLRDGPAKVDACDKITT